MFAKEEKNRFYHLPKELIIYIYSFDSTYKSHYSKCMNEMTKKFHINRINDRILGEKNIYEVYLFQMRNRNSIYGDSIYGDSVYGNNCYFSEYILKRIKQFGDQVPNQRLKYHNLTKLK